MIKDEVPKRPKKYPKGHMQERERIVKELRRVYVEVSTKNALLKLDHAYRKVMQLQKGNVLPWIDLLKSNKYVCGIENS